MAKVKQCFRCEQCNYETVKWMGRCPSCGNWNTITEQRPRRSGSSPSSRSSSSNRPVSLLDINIEEGGSLRLRSGIHAFDAVLGGGLVSGSLTLLGGDPGVGKSTLLLMALDQFARKGLPVLYVTGEESARQVRLRAQRLGVAGRSLHIFAENDFTRVEDVARDSKSIAMVVDSVQTMQIPDVSGIPGSMSQVREVAHRAMTFAKETSTATLLVGHITKSGQLAGPKVLEHVVDTVVVFEGDGRSSLRILRAVKNRFGPAGELGLFEMTEDGLKAVADPSARLLSERIAGASGTVVVATMEGTRPLLAEVQALVGSPGNPTPTRTVVGIDRSRVLMLSAVLQKRGLTLHDRDIFTNAAGGVRLEEPAADLAIIAALMSSFQDRPLRQDTLVFGEVGLVGEVRAVSYPALRLREAARHGFRRAVVPASCASISIDGLEVVGVRTVRQALEAIV